MFLSEIKKQASSFLQEKYKSARLVLTDVTQAQLLTEEATSGDSWGPDAKTMTRISEAAYDKDDYCRIVHVLHKRLMYVNWKEWRQSYKTLVLLEFLLTHGPDGLFEEFHCDIDVIRELGHLNYVDERGFNWGACMRSKSQKLTCLLTNKSQLKEARAKALKISNEIKGFGNLIVSPSSSTSPASSRSSATCSFGSCYSTDDSPTWSFSTWQQQQQQQEEEEELHRPSSGNRKSSSGDEMRERSPAPPTNAASRYKLDRGGSGGGGGSHLWDDPIEETGSLTESLTRGHDGDDDDKGKDRNSNVGIFARLFGSNSSRLAAAAAGGHKQQQGFRSLSNVTKAPSKKIERRLSLGL